MNMTADDVVATSIKNAARITSLSRSRIYQLLDAGKLRSVRVGKRRLVLMESIYALLSAKKEG